MVVVALIISILSLLVAGWSVLYAQRMHDIEAARRREEIAPKISAEFFTTRDKTPHLRFRNEGPPAIGRLDVEIVPAQIGEPSASFFDAGLMTADHTFPAAQVGDAHQIALSISARSGAIRVLCTAWQGEASWPSLISVPFEMPREFMGSAY